MDVENDRITKLIFPNGLPENLQNSIELPKYLQKLGTYKIDQLKKEETRLENENRFVVEQTQELAISNYKTFIKAAECSKLISTEFQNTEKCVDSLIESLPKFSENCQNFLEQTKKINSERSLNSITLSKNKNLLEILELPQLMAKCIKSEKYEEALELAAYVQKLGQKHGNIGVINNIVSVIESSWHTMLCQLIAQLRTDLQLPKCLQVVGYLRRMQAFDNLELKLKFLQVRNSWLTEILNNIPKNDPQQHLTKTIELTRINVFNIITQYKAVFPDDDVTVNSKKSSETISDGRRLFHAWLHEKIDNFLQTLEEDLERGIPSLDTVLGQCMYFGLSFSRIGADFRALMVPIFVRVILENFIQRISKVQQQFEYDLDKFTLVNKISSHIRKIDAGSINEEESYAPPDSLLDFHPLAVLCNGYMSALNEIRLCAPIALAENLTKTLQISLAKVGKSILSFYKQEQQAFTGNEKENFIRFCTCFAYDLCPYIQKCIHVIFPHSVLTSHLGINLIALQNTGITFLNQKEILEPLKHLIPDKNIMIAIKHQDFKASETRRIDAVESN